MTIIISIVLLIAWLVLVLKWADYLVDGASSLAFKLGVPSLVIGLTIVSFGTSAPELVVSVISAIKWSTQAALGNVIGSNLFNTLLILGVTSLFASLRVQSTTVWKEIPFALLAVVSVFLLGLSDVFNGGQLLNIDLMGNSSVGILGAAQWLILLSFFAVFMYYVFGLAQADSTDSDVPELLPQWQSWLMIVWWLAALVFWWQLAVTHAVKLATVIGMSEKIIWLTILSIGTSLPELVTSIKAARKGQSDIAIGNVVGSNIFNIFWILGVSALITPIPLIGSNVFDLYALIWATLFLFGLLFIKRRFHLEKLEWVLMIVAYVAYIIYLIIQW